MMQTALCALLVVLVVSPWQVSGQLLTTWHCECSGYTFSIAKTLPSWDTGGHTYANALTFCSTDGATLPAADGDMMCFLEYVDYLYAHFNLVGQQRKVWLESAPAGNCSSYRGCEISPEQCITTLRFLCQTKTTPNPNPPHIPNAVTGPITPLPDTQVTYSCNQGHEASGTAPYTSTCTGQKYWSVPLLACNAVTCPAIEAPGNGAATFTNGFSYLSVAQFTCLEGYLLSDSASLHCQASKVWNGTAPVCTAVNCEAPPLIPFSKVSYSQTTYGAIADYTCDLGHQSPRDKTTFFITQCQANAQWNNTDVICEALDCGPPPLFPNTQVEYNASDYLSVARYTCTTGHEQENPEQPYRAVCNETGLWQDNYVNCVDVDCEAPPNLANSDVHYTSTTYQSVAAYYCHEGYRNTTFKTSAVCEATKAWSVDNIRCDLEDCGPPSHYPDSIVEVESTTYGSIATYLCADGFEHPSGEPTPVKSTCMATGNWQAVEVMCQAKNCPELQAPTNGFIAFTNGTLYRSVAKFACNPGYKITGEDLLQCQLEKTWNHAAPTCGSEVHCPVLEPPQNGNATILLGDENQVNTVVAFTCHYGYQLNGSSTTVCTALGEWTNAVPVCQEVFIPTTPAETSTPEKQSSLEPSAISSIILGLIVLLFIVAAVFILWRLKKTTGRRYNFFSGESAGDSSTGDSRKFTDSTRHSPASSRRSERDPLVP
ncbi:sushi, von Willebrand factor type A, EGF and pentraxin domain-containing protein 1-like [Sycon ciliatum]|uniref:sushi, von Willebrand factor type A, EGF and pentraxin domain-containing protein 1-like n=1 Tax=Sycon ciliatum TaxID=27933 RepID=UPI0031F6041D